MMRDISVTLVCDAEMVKEFTLFQSSETFSRELYKALNDSSQLLKHAGMYPIRLQEPLRVYKYKHAPT